MNRRLKLEERKKALLADSRRVLDAAATEERELSQEEKDALEKNEKELAQLQSGIDREVRLAEYERSLAAETPGSRGEDRWPGQLGNARPAWRDDPNVGFRTPREFFSAVMRATIEGRTNDERLMYLAIPGQRPGLQATAGSDEAGTYSDPYGGFLVPAGFLPTLLAVPSEGDPTAGRTTLVPMSAPRITIPARTDKDHTTSVTGGLLVYRRSETQTVTATRMAMEQVELNAIPLMGLSYATEELLTDSAISFAALIEAGFRSEFASKLLEEKINGTGAGQFEGAINSPALVTIAKETGQEADSIVFENVIKMRARCWRYQDAIWLYNHDTLPQLMQLVMTIGTSGVPMWQTSARDGEPDQLLGRPAFATEYCPKLGDKGDLLLGNWSQFLEGTYQQLESAESMHVRFENNERTFRFLMRNDGRSWWRSALTPRKSSDTLSPFVVIAARA
jgi:HK97 family phage major capsid protein